MKCRLTGDLHAIVLLWCKTRVKPVESVKKLFVKRRLNGAPLPLVVFRMYLGFWAFIHISMSANFVHEQMAWLHTCLTISQVGGDLKFHEDRVTTL